MLTSLQWAQVQVLENKESLKERVAPGIEVVLQRQVDGSYGVQAAQKVGTTNSEYTIDENGLNIQVELFDGAVQKLEPQALWDTSLYHSHYLLIAAYIGQQLMNDCLQKEIFWPRMANDVYKTISDCRTCARIVKFKMLKGQILFLFVKILLQFLDIDIFSGRCLVQ